MKIIASLLLGLNFRICWSRVFNYYFVYFGPPIANDLPQEMSQLVTRVIDEETGEYYRIEWQSFRIDYEVSLKQCETGSDFEALSAIYESDAAFFNKKEHARNVDEWERSLYKPYSPTAIVRFEDNSMESLNQAILWAQRHILQYRKLFYIAISTNNPSVDVLNRFRELQNPNKYTWVLDWTLGSTLVHHLDYIINEHPLSGT